MRVLLDTGSSGDLLFLEKGSNKYIPVVSRAVQESWSTSNGNGTFKTKKVGEVELSFVDYSASKKVHLRPDKVEYSKRGPQLLYDLMIGKQPFALSLLFNLEAARQGRSVLFSTEQKLLFEGLKKGFVKNTILDFMIH
jgi:hypothetical protein